MTSECGAEMIWQFVGGFASSRTLVEMERCAILPKIRGLWEVLGNVVWSEQLQTILNKLTQQRRPEIRVARKWNLRDHFSFQLCMWPFPWEDTTCKYWIAPGYWNRLTKMANKANAIVAQTV